MFSEAVQEWPASQADRALSLNVSQAGQGQGWAGLSKGRCAGRVRRSTRQAGPPHMSQVGHAGQGLGWGGLGWAGLGWARHQGMTPHLPAGWQSSGSTGECPSADSRTAGSQDAAAQEARLWCGRQAWRGRQARGAWVWQEERRETWPTMHPSVGHNKWPQCTALALLWLPLLEGVGGLWPITAGLDQLPRHDAGDTSRSLSFVQFGPHPPSLRPPISCRTLSTTRRLTASFWLPRW